MCAAAIRTGSTSGMNRSAESNNELAHRAKWRYLPVLAALIAIGAALAAESVLKAQFPQRQQESSQQPSQQQGSLGAAGQSEPEVERKNSGCLSCHVTTDEPTMHATGTVHLACVDCHGGDSSAQIAPGTASSSPEYAQAKNRAHPKSSNPEFARSSANPVRSYTSWLRENYDYIRFINPGDLRVASKSCGQSGCHAAEVLKVQTSMMTTGALLWGAALYNNGAYPIKNAHFGESYSADGVPQDIRTIPQPTPEETRTKGILAGLTPLERWEISQPGNVLRVFERGGEKKSEIGNPDREEESGRPDDKLSDRGFGTELRTDPVFLGLQKTRLLDPLLYLPGTNDQPGDYRASGCTACHVVYANDRSPDHSGRYANFGNLGQSAT